MEEFKNNEIVKQERKPFDPTKVIFDIEAKGVWGMLGQEITLMSDKGEQIGYVQLWDEDPVVADAVKIKYIGVGEPYRGSEAVYLLYEKALQIAMQKGKELVLDCSASASAYKSFKKFAEKRHLFIIENENVAWTEEGKTYRATPGTWTLKINPYA